MKNSFYKFFFLILILVGLSNVFSQNQKTINNNINLITKEKEFVAGSTITLIFKGLKNKDLYLYCSSSYGVSILQPQYTNSVAKFLLPDYLKNKSGVIRWQLISKKDKLSGVLKITPKVIPFSLETYFGPSSITSGGKDFSYFVVIPTDILDNPMADNTPINVKHQFLSDQISTNLSTKNSIAFKKIYSPLQTGKIFIASSSSDLHSKEYTISNLPSIAVNFNIYASRNHPFADGNEVTKLYTSLIKDIYGNIISDGSFVSFYIKNKKGNTLKTNGITLNGIATAKIIHPEFEDNWQIKAYITGIAESNTLLLTYKNVFTSLTTSFTNKNRQLVVGPLHSFMKQRIPDGLKVTVSIFHKDSLVNTIEKKSIDGFVKFNFNANIFKSGNYKLIISAAGNQKEINNLKLW